MRTIFAIMMTKLLTADAAAGANTAAAPEAEKPAKVEKPKAVKQNGVAKPGAETSCGRIWAIADEISAKENRPALRAEVIKAADAEGINPSTASTQFGRWHKFWGIPAAPKVIPAQKPKAEKPAKKSEKSAKGATAAEGKAAMGEADVEAPAGETAAEGAQA